MKEIFLNPAKTCAFTGHRVLYDNYSEKLTVKEIKNAVKDGFDTFLVGMALGFDTECFKLLLKFREKKDIKIVACVPCVTQPERFNKEQKKTYFDLLSKADDVKIISEKYTPACMRKRNEFMVDNSSRLIAYLKRDYGGTKKTVDYAVKRGVKVVYV